jgi:hypothetical protein
MKTAGRSAFKFILKDERQQARKQPFRGSFFYSH